MTNSTFFGNMSQADFGGGIFNQLVATITSSTITGNTAASQGGGIENIGTITVTNSVVAGNTEAGSPNDDCGSCGMQSASNLFSTAGTPVTAAQVMLAPLAYYGLNQAVRTMLPLPGSPVIQAGDPAFLPTELDTDERLLPRTIGGKLDLGAVEANYTSVQFVQQPSNTTVNLTMSPAVTMSVTESGTTVANIPLPITFSGSGALHGTLTESTQAPCSSRQSRTGKLRRSERRHGRDRLHANFNRHRHASGSVTCTDTDCDQRSVRYYGTGSGHDNLQSCSATHRRVWIGANYPQRGSVRIGYADWTDGHLPGGLRSGQHRRQDSDLCRSRYGDCECFCRCKWNLCRGQRCIQHRCNSGSIDGDGRQCQPRRRSTEPSI